MFHHIRRDMTDIHSTGNSFIAAAGLANMVHSIKGHKMQEELILHNWAMKTFSTQTSKKEDKNIFSSERVEYTSNEAIAVSLPFSFCSCSFIKTDLGSKMNLHNANTQTYPHTQSYRVYWTNNKYFINNDSVSYANILQDRSGPVLTFFLQKNKQAKALDAWSQHYQIHPVSDKSKFLWTWK